MNKEEIERIALDVMRSIAAEDADAPIEVVDDMSSEDKRIMVEFCARFLARIDAERGKEAVAWWDGRYNDPRFSLTANSFGADERPLFRSPRMAAPCTSCADSSAEAEAYKTQWAICCAERDALQAKVAEQADAIRQSALNVGNWYRKFMKATERVVEQDRLIDRCEKALVIAYPNWEQYGDWEINAWARDIIAAIASHRKGIAK